MTKNKIDILVMAVVFSAWAVSFAFAQEISIESLPPSVVKTVPMCGDTGVNPTINEIRVTFSKDMMTKQMWSWCMYSPETFPEITDQSGIKYLDDNRTCILPVELQPGKTYVIWINDQHNNGFRDTMGKPAIPYLLVFKTK